VQIQPRPVFWFVLAGVIAFALVVGRIFGPGWGIAALVAGCLTLTALGIEGDARLFRRAPPTPEE
jgi:hypothetical protein